MAEHTKKPRKKTRKRALGTQFLATGRATPAGLEIFDPDEPISQVERLLFDIGLSPLFHFLPRNFGRPMLPMPEQFGTAMTPQEEQFFLDPQRLIDLQNLINFGDIRLKRI